VANSAKGSSECAGADQKESHVLRLRRCRGIA
jgi:hypothetical protein